MAKEWEEHADKKIWMGIGVAIFGLILLWTSMRWDIAFTTIGVLAILKGLLDKYYMKK